MIELQALLNRLNEIAPLAIAEDWDNVGLLVGDPTSQIKNVMTCLTATSDVVDEAIAKKVDCIVAHHPIPFKPISRITTTTSTGKYLWKLASAHIAVYSPHTAWDNALTGINQQLAELFQLQDSRPITPLSEDASCKLLKSFKDTEVRQMGTGRIGVSPQFQSLSDVIHRMQAVIDHTQIQSNVPTATKVNRIAFVCGSGGSYAGSARRAGADLLITGEATYHQFLEASSLGLSMMTIGHYQSESFSMATLAESIHKSFPSIEVWRSDKERDAYCVET